MNKDFLIDKWLYWNSARTKEQFFKDDINEPVGGGIRYAIEKIDEGFLIAQTTSISYFSSVDGKIYRLDSAFGDKDFECNLLLYKHSQESKVFFVDKPLEYSKFNLANKTIQYSVLQRPFNNLGSDIGLEIGNQKFTFEDLELWVEKVTEILPFMKKTMEYHQSGLPNNGILVTDLINSNNEHAWKGFRRWSQSSTNFKECAKQSLMINCFLCYKFLSYQTNIDKKKFAERTKKLINNAILKWNNIL